MLKKLKLCSKTCSQTLQTWMAQPWRSSPGLSHPVTENGARRGNSDPPNWQGRYPETEWETSSQEHKCRSSHHNIGRSSPLIRKEDNSMAKWVLSKEHGVSLEKWIGVIQVKNLIVVFMHQVSSFFFAGERERESSSGLHTQDGAQRGAQSHNPEIMTWAENQVLVA